MLVNTLERARAIEDLQHLREKLEHENVYLRKEVKERVGEHIVGRSAVIRAALALADQVAATDSTVLLLGETGTGKERFASYIHGRSRRRDRPMIRVNCTAIPASLIESELFGREKGAYTGALSKQIGRFELAHGSTLFLDEIGELPSEMQVKLLRILENHTIERLGNPKPILVDVRIIAATNRNIDDALHGGQLRQDLYYRLNVFPISIPPLRNRREDIPLFIDAFVEELEGTMAKKIDEIDSASLEAVLAYGWPGNVRELRNLVERAMILATGTTLRLYMDTKIDETASGSSVTSVERTRVLQILQETGWRIRGAHGASARLGLKPTTLESRIKRLGITRPGQ
jgi:transcriptional regulator with GAF, ATPase, and Fis domain